MQLTNQLNICGLRSHSQYQLGLKSLFSAHFYPHIYQTNSLVNTQTALCIYSELTFTHVLFLKSDLFGELNRRIRTRFRCSGAWWRDRQSSGIKFHLFFIFLFLRRVQHIGDLSRWVLRIEINLDFECHTVIFIMLECESIIQQQESISASSVTVKHLFSFREVTLGFSRH